MQQRRYDLDWLRVIALAVLIFYHIGMLYVADWGFHYKSQYQSEFLQYFMLLVNRWRLPLLFFISGVATHYLLARYTLFDYAKKRSWRLLLPLLFGVLVIVPPQLYVEMRSNENLLISYWQFYQVFFDLDHALFTNYQSGILPHMDVNHLWYLRELWCFSVILLFIHPLYVWINASSLVDLLWQKLGFLGVFFIPILCLSIAAICLFPGSSEGIRIAQGFCFFLLGYIIWQNKYCWQLISDYRLWSLVLAVSSYIGLIVYYQLFILTRTVPLTGIRLALETTLLLANRWVWVLVILGYAHVYLNKPSVLLNYLANAVYPSYLVHQTVLIVAAFYLAPWSLGGVIEPILVISITILCCFLVYELTRRVKVLRPLMGIPNGTSKLKNAKLNTAFSLFAWVFIVPLGFLIII
jgi:hypothetical protein